MKIITDSTADLTKEQVERYGITVVPLQVHLGGETYKDGVNINQKELFRRVEEIGKLPQTAAPNITDFVSAFAGEDEKLFIGLSSKLSATVQTAILAAEEAKGRVHIVDSLSISAGMGLIVLKAAEMMEQGTEPDEVEKAVRELVQKSRVVFAIDTLKYLHMGGRCSALQALIGSVLKVRPIIETRPDGTLGVKDKVRGKRERTLEVLLEEFKADLPNVDLSRVAVGHAACEDDARKLAEEIKRIASPDEVYVYEAGSVISSHCGPGTYGISYLLK